ncbi:MAG: tandem-95 repeat protein [Oceanicola sp.]|nr:tandem-95 repeat protein [Oceanicola sp.]
MVAQITAPARMVAGEYTEITVTLVNQGGPMPPEQSSWVTRLRLSRDDLITANDPIVGQVYGLSNMDTGDSSEHTVRLRVPPGLEPGPWRLIAQVDRPDIGAPDGFVLEGPAGEANNITRVAVQIDAPPPANLVPVGVTLPAGLIAGDEIDIAWEIFNAGDNATGPAWSDAIYLSRDGAYDADDILLVRAENEGALGAGQNLQRSTKVRVPMLAEGEWRVILRTDLLGEIDEGAGEAGNTVVTTRVVTVTVPRIGLNEPIAFDLAPGVERLIKVEVPFGQTLQAMVAGLDGPLGGPVADLMVGYQGPPDRSDPLAADLSRGAERATAVVAGTSPGDHYILVRGVAGGASTVQLEARLLPLSIDTVTVDRLGAGAWVTTEINGAQFAQGATVRLSRPGFEAYEPQAWSVVDSSRIIASFDLTGATRGLYDVSVTNPDGTIAVLPYRVMVDPPRAAEVEVALDAERVMPFWDSVHPIGVALRNASNLDAEYVFFRTFIPEMGQNVLVLDDVRNSFARYGDAIMAQGAALSGDGPFEVLNPSSEIRGRHVSSGYAFGLAPGQQARADMALHVYPGVEDPTFEEVLAMPFDTVVAVAATPMTRAEFEAQQRALAEALRQALLADPAASPELFAVAADGELWSDLYIGALEDAGVLRLQDGVPPVREQPLVASMLSTLAQGALAGPLGGQATGAGGARGLFEALTALYAGDAGVQAALLGQGPIQLDVHDGTPFVAVQDAEAFDMGLEGATASRQTRLFMVPSGDLQPQDISVGAEPEEIISALGPDAIGGQGQMALDLRQYLIDQGRSTGGATLVGPDTSDTDGWLPHDTDLPFTLGAVADESAGAVRSLRASVPLDPDLDPESFTLADMRLGSIGIDVPQGKRLFQTEIDLRTSRGFILRVSAGIDLLSSTPTATWLIEAIDPLSGVTLPAGEQGLLLPGQTAELGWFARSATGLVSGNGVSAEAVVLMDDRAPERAANAPARLDLRAPTTRLQQQDLGGGRIALDWAAADDVGVQHVTLYAQEPDGPWRILVRRAEGAASGYVAENVVPGTRFLALATDIAGNIERPALAEALPADGPRVDLGAPPETARTPADPPLAQPGPAPTNPLFLAAQIDQLTPYVADVAPASFSALNTPFAGEAFAASIPTSEGSIGALDVLELSDGRVWVTGGVARASIWELDLENDGAPVGEPIQTADLPLYDLAEGLDGRVWAATGGGPLLELDRLTGEVIARHGDSVGTAVAVSPLDGTLVVAGVAGAAVFDPVTEAFTPLGRDLDLRLGALAFDDSGTLWGVSWPGRDRVVRMTETGRVETVHISPHPIDSLAFGQTGTALQNLLFVTSVAAEDTPSGTSAGTGGVLTLIDPSSLQAVEIADGGLRGEGVTTTSDGRVLVAQGSVVDAILPVFAPEVEASNPAPGDLRVAPLPLLEITFDQRMLDAEPGVPGSVRDPANYALRGSDGTIETPEFVAYSESTRTAHLGFGALPGDTWTMVVDGAANIYGVPLNDPYEVPFTLITNLSDVIELDLSATRFDRSTGDVSFDVALTNTLDRPVRLPLLLTLDTDGGLGVPPEDAQAIGEGAWTLDLSALLPDDGVLQPGETTTGRTVQLDASGRSRPDVLFGSAGNTGPNAAPEFGDLPNLPELEIGTPWTFDLTATDPDGDPVLFGLLDGPQGMALDAVTGTLSWTPNADVLERSTVTVQAFDTLGAARIVRFDLDVIGGNSAPRFVNMPSELVGEAGQTLQLRVNVSDPDGDPLAVFADGLPPGARFDPITRTLTWMPETGQEGLWPDLRLIADDGTSQSVAFVPILIDAGADPLVLRGPSEASVAEGGRIVIRFEGEGGGAGRALRFEADRSSLPPGAVLNPETGALSWTPGYDQAGEWDATIALTDGEARIERSVQITVAPANAAPVFFGMDAWQVYEGRELTLSLFPYDPDSPYARPPVRLPDGSLDFADVPLSTTTRVVSGLPAGASFDPDTTEFTWTPGPDDAGVYEIVLETTDDGGGVPDGVPITVRDTLSLRVLPANILPEIDFIDPVTVASGETRVLTLRATDGDGDIPRLQLETDAPQTALPGFVQFIDNGDGSGTVTIAPGAGDRGLYSLRVTATDGDGADTTFGFTLEATSSNEAPVLGPLYDAVAVAGEAQTLLLPLSDLDGETLDVQVSGLPGLIDMMPSDTTGLWALSFNPDPGALGTHQVQISVTDQGGADGAPVTVSDAFTLTVRTANTAPRLDAVGDRTVPPGGQLLVQLVGRDLDGDSLHYSARGLPAGATLDPQTGVLEWTPRPGQLGREGIVLSVTDGHETATETIALRVDLPERPPVFDPVAPQLVREGDELIIAVGARDPEQGDVFLSLAQGPADMVFDPVLGVARWRPSYGDAGNYQISILALDGAGQSAEQTIEINVVNVNRAPELTLADAGFAVGVPKQVQANASDADGDHLTYRLINAPEGVTVDDEGRLSWTPQPGQSGDHLIVLEATDGVDPRRVVALWSVRDLPVAPSIRVETTPDFPAVPGQPVLIRPVIDAAAPVVRLAVTADGQDLPRDQAGRFILVPDMPGRVTIEVTVEDADGATATQTHTLKVRDPDDVDAPLLDLLELPNGPLDSPVDIAGAVSDSNLDTWSVALIDRSGVRPALTLAEGDAGITGVLAQLDPAKMPDGWYVLRVVAADMGGRRTVRDTLIEIAQPNKTARLLHDTTDASLSLGGVALDLVRRFDSFAAGAVPRGHLAEGWHFATLDMRVESERGLSDVSGLGLETALRSGERALVSLPDGTKAGFTFAPVSVQENGRSFARPAWVPDDPDAGWQLETGQAELIRVGGRWYTVSAAAPYNPGASGGVGDDYRVTGPDGRVYALDAERGLTRITTADGGLVHVSDAGLIGRDGNALRFERDSAGRVTRIVGEGIDMSYRTDDEGRLQLVRNLLTGAAERMGHTSSGELRLATNDAGGSAWAGDTEMSFGADLATLTSWGDASDSINFGPDGHVVHSLVVRASELASTASGRVHIQVTLAGGATGATLDGVDPIGVSDDGSVLVFAVDRPGLLALEVTGTGAHQVRLQAVGDLDLDGDVDADDTSAFGAGTDVDGDGDVDTADRALFNANFGLQPNRPPQPVGEIPPFLTHVDVPIEIDLASLLADAEGDDARYVVLGAVNGTGWIRGETGVFLPQTGVSGDAELIIQADDGWTLSDPIHIPITISDAPLLALDFVGRAQVMATAGIDVPLQLIADFADAEDVDVPLWWAGVQSSDPDVIQISPDGSLIGLARGHVVISAGRGDIAAATIAGVAKADTLDEALTLAGGIDAYPDAVTVLQASQSRQIVTSLGSLGEHFRGQAAQGTRYVVADARIVSVTEDGLITALQPGETTVTVLHGFGEETITVKVLGAVGGASAEVGAEGAILQSASGTRLSVAPGSLPDGTAVSLVDIAFEDLDAKLEGLGLGGDANWGFLGAVDVQMSVPSTETDTPMQLAVPTNGAAQPGETVAFFQRIEMPTGPDDAMEWHWALFDTGTVGDDGLARTASPPFPGLTDRGQVLAARVGFPSKVVKVDYVSDALIQAALYAGALISDLTGGLVDLSAYMASMAVTVSGAISLNYIVPDGDYRQARLEAFKKTADGTVERLEYELELDPELTFEDIDLVPTGEAPPPSIQPGSVSAAFAGVVDRPVITQSEIVEVFEDATQVKLSGFLFMDDALSYDLYEELDAEDIRNSRIRLNFNGQNFYIHGNEFVDIALRSSGTTGEYVQDIIFDVPQYVLLGATEIFVERPIVPRYTGPEPWDEDAEFVTSQPIRFNNEQQLLYVTSRTFGDPTGLPDRGYLEVIRPAPLGSNAADELIRRVPLPRDYLDVGVEMVASPNGAAIFVATLGAVEVFDTISQRFVDFSAADPANLFVAKELRGIPIPEGPITDMAMSEDGLRLFVSAKASIYEIDLSQGAEDFMTARKLLTLDVEVWDQTGAIDRAGENSAHNIIHAIELSKDGRRLYALTPYGERNMNMLRKSHIKFRESSQFWRSEMHVIDVDPALKGVRGERALWELELDDDGNQIYEPDGAKSKKRTTQTVELYGAKLGPAQDRAGDRFNGAMPMFASNGRWIVKNDARDLSRTNRDGVMTVTRRGAFGNGVAILFTTSDDPDTFSLNMETMKATVAQWRGFPDDMADALGMTRNAYNAWGYNLGETDWIPGKGGRQYPFLQRQIGTSFQRYDLDIQTAGEILMSPDGLYAFVVDTGHRSSPDRSTLAKIENQTTIGTKIGVVLDPLGSEPRFLGSVGVFPNQEIKDIALDPSGQRLVATLWHSDTVLAYDTSALIARATEMITSTGKDVNDPSIEPLDLNDTQGVNKPGIDISRPSAIAFSTASEIFVTPVTEPIVNWGENRDELRLTFGWDPEKVPNSDEGVQLYLSTRAPGLGLFPSDPPLHDAGGDKALKPFANDYNPGRVWSTPQGFAFKIGRAYEIGADRIVQDLGEASQNGTVEVTFSEDFMEIVTAGTTLYWGVQFGAAGIRAASSVEVAARAAGADEIAHVTLLTHGFQPFMSVLDGAWSVGYGQPETMLKLAREISDASGGAAVLLYDKRTGQWVNPENGLTGAAGITLGRGVVLVSDWVTESDITDEGFSEAAADALFASLMALDQETEHRLLDAPLHMIGHNRGASVNSEIAQRLAAHLPEINDVHVTTLDPFDQSQETLELPVEDMLLMIRWTNRLAAVVNVAKSVAAAVTTGGASLAVDAVPTASSLATQGLLEKAITTVFEVAGKLGIKIGVVSWDDFKDPDVKRWDNIAFHDNYFQTAAKGKKDGSDVTNTITDFFANSPVTASEAEKAMQAFLQSPDRWTVARRAQWEWLKLKFDVGLDLPGPFTFSANGRSLKGIADYEIDLSTTATGFDRDDFQIDAVGFRFGLNNPTERVLAWYAGTIDPKLELFLDVPIWRRAGDIAQDIRPYSMATENKFDERGWYGASSLALVLSDNMQSYIPSRYKSNPPGLIREGVGQGWFWSAGGGGDIYQPVKSTLTATPYTEDNSEQGAWKSEGAVPEIFNGNFEHGTRQSLVNMIASMIDVGAYIENFTAQPENATVAKKSSKERLFGKDALKSLFSGQVTSFGRFPFSYELPGWSFHGGEGFSAGLDAFRADIAGLFVMNTNPTGLFVDVFDALFDVYAGKITDAATKYLTAKVLKNNETINNNQGYANYKEKVDAIEGYTPAKASAAIKLRDQQQEKYKLAEQEFRIYELLNPVDPVGLAELARLRQVRDDAKRLLDSYENRVKLNGEVEGLHKQVSWLSSAILNDDTWNHIKAVRPAIFGIGPNNDKEGKLQTLESWLKVETDGVIDISKKKDLTEFIKEALKFTFFGKNPAQQDNAILMGGSEALKQLLEGAFSIFGGGSEMGEFVSSVVDELTEFDTLVHNRFWLPETGTNYLTFDTMAPMTVGGGAAVEVMFLKGETTEGAKVSSDSPNVLYRALVPLPEGFFEKTTHSIEVPESLKGQMVKLVIRNVGMETVANDVDITAPEVEDSTGEIEQFFLNASTSLSPGVFGLSQVYLIDNIALSAVPPSTGQAQEATRVAQNVSATVPLAADQVDAVADAARALWQATGVLTPEQDARLATLDFEVRDLGGTILALFDGEQVLLDDDAAGNGWSAAGVDGWQVHNAALRSVDLLTVIAHEMGHALGLPDLPGSGTEEDLMVGALATGVRRVPDADDLVPSDVAAPATPLTLSDVLGTAPRTRLAATTGSTNAIVGAAATTPPVNTTIENGNFDVDDPAGLGWTLVGDAQVVDGRALISESASVFSGITQAFLHDGSATALELTLSEISLTAEPRRVPDAIEIALRDEATGAPLVAVSGLSGTDALISIQADGALRVASGVSVEGTRLPDGRLDLSQALRVLIPLTNAVVDAGYRVSVDLLGFGGDDAQFAVDDVRLLTGANGNLRPVSEPDTAGTTAGTPVRIDVLANDTDAESDALDIVITMPPAHGTAVIQNGAVLYTPEVGFAGADTFFYVARDAGGDSLPAQVTVTVAPPAALPVIVDPGPQFVSEGATLSLSLTGIDAAATGGLTWALLSGPVGAALDATSGQLTWQSADGASSENFLVELRDADGGTRQASFDVTVADVAPQITLTGAASVAAGQTYTVAFDVADVVADAPTEIVVTWGNGTSSILPGTAREASTTYAAAGDFSVGITVTNKDGIFAGPDLAVEVRDVVVNPPAPVVESFTATRSVLTVVTDRAMIEPAPGLFVLEEANGRVISTSVSLSGTGRTVTVTPDTELNRGDYVLRIADGWTARPAEGGAALDGDGDTIAGGAAELTFRILAGVSPPIAVADTATTAFESAVTLDVLANDIAGSAGAPVIASFGPAQNGQVSQLGDGRLVYTPNAGFSGVDSFTYSVSDGVNLSEPVTVTLTVSGSVLVSDPSDGGGASSDGGGSVGGAPVAPVAHSGPARLPGFRGIAVVPSGESRAQPPSRLQSTLIRSSVQTTQADSDGASASGVCRAASVAMIGGQIVTLPTLVAPGDSVALSLPNGAPEGMRINWGTEGSVRVPVGATTVSRRFDSEGIRAVTITHGSGDTATQETLYVSVGRPDPVRIVEAVMRGGRLVLTFSRAVSPDVLEDGRVWLADRAGRTVDMGAVLSRDGTVLTITPLGLDLVPGTLTLRLQSGPLGVLDMLGCQIDGDGDGRAGGHYIAEFDMGLDQAALNLPDIVYEGAIVAGGPAFVRGQSIGIPLLGSGAAAELSVRGMGADLAPEAVTGDVQNGPSGPVLGDGAAAVVWLDSAPHIETLTVAGRSTETMEREIAKSQSASSELAAPVVLAGILGLARPAQTAGQRSKARRAAKAPAVAPPDGHGISGAAALLRVPLGAESERPDKLS